MIGMILAVIFFLSLIMALFSMKDFQTPAEIARFIALRKIRGTIIFFKDKISHYSSSSSSTST